AVVGAAQALDGADPTVRRAIVLLTDGLDTASRNTTASAVARLAAAGLPLYAVGLGENLDRSVLQALAQASPGGAAYIARTAPPRPRAHPRRCCRAGGADTRDRPTSTGPATARARRAAPAHPARQIPRTDARAFGVGGRAHQRGGVHRHPIRVDRRVRAGAGADRLPRSWGP